MQHSCVGSGRSRILDGHKDACSIVQQSLYVCCKYQRCEGMMRIESTLQIMKTHGTCKKLQPVHDEADQCNGIPVENECRISLQRLKVKMRRPILLKMFAKVCWQLINLCLIENFQFFESAYIPSCDKVDGDSFTTKSATSTNAVKVGLTIGW
jgi:hypothetical protein